MDQTYFTKDIKIIKDEEIQKYICEGSVCDVIAQNELRLEQMDSKL